MSSSPWTILGAGSMGCLWAAQLHRSTGQIPTLIVKDTRRYDQVDHTITLTHLDGAESRHSVALKAAGDIELSIHKLLVCTKAGDALDAVNSVSHSLANECDILLLQNGMGSQQAIAAAYPDRTVWVGSITDGAWMKSPLHVCHAGAGKTHIGSFVGNPVGKLLNHLEPFPLELIGTDAIESILWRKLAMNCAVNGLTALFDCQNGALLEPDKKARMDPLIEEFIQASHRLNQPVSDRLYGDVYDICRMTARNYSSTCMDVRLNRTTELAYLNGYLLDQAASAGLQLPAHKALMQQLSQQNVRW